MKQHPTLECALESLSLHDHCCLIFDDRQEQLAAVSAFLRWGLKRGEKCIWVLAEETEAAAAAALQEAGVDVEGLSRTSALELRSARRLVASEVTQSEGPRRLAWMKPALEKALAEGFKGLRTTVEVAQACPDGAARRCLLPHESRLSDLLAAHPCLTLCQYERKRFPPEVLLGAIRAHPFVIYRGSLLQNFYYVPAEELLGPDQSAREVDRFLESISPRGQVEAALRLARGELEARVRERTRQLERANEALRAEMEERTRALAAYQASEQRYRHLFEEADDIICTLDLQCNFTSVNRAGERVTGYQREKLLGRNLAVLAGPEAMDLALKMLQAKLGGQGSTTYELPIRTRDGERVLLEVRSRLLFDRGRPSGILAIGRDVTERKRTEEVLRESEAALERSREQLRALAAGLLTAQEEERRRLSRELHDDLNQKLAMLAVQAESLEQELPPTHQEIRARIARLRDGANALSDDIRHMAYELHPSILDHLGLVVALRSYCKDFSRRHGIRTKFVARRLPQTIPPGAALCLYRVAQEALANVAKHSRSPRATVSLSGGTDSLRLTVTDYGVGFDTARPENRCGLGLISMEERVRLADGAFAVTSRPRGGTRLDVRIPLRREDP